MDVSLPARTKEASLVHGQTKKLSQRVQGSWSKQCSVLLLGRGCHWLRSHLGKSGWNVTLGTQREAWESGNGPDWMNSPYQLSPNAPFAKKPKGSLYPSTSCPRGHHYPGRDESTADSLCSHTYNVQVPTPKRQTVQGAGFPEGFTPCQSPLRNMGHVNTSAASDLSHRSPYSTSAAL